MASEKIFTTDLNVRFRDLDAMGHVNNAVFFTYFEEGRKGFFQKNFEKSGAFDFPFILAHVECDYKKPITLNDAIRLFMWVGEIGNKRFDFIYRITDRLDEAVVFASGRSVQVSFDYRKQQSTALPKDVIDHLLPYQDSASKTNF